MVLPINTTHRKVFRQILEVIRSIPPLDSLRSRELDVLAVLMYYNYKYKNVSEDIRWRVINDTSTKREMQSEIDMSEDIFNNNISLVRKSGLIDKEGKISKFLMIDPDNHYEVSFNFKIHKEDEL
jgi:hypothetical protein